MLLKAWNDFSTNGNGLLPNFNFTEMEELQLQTKSNSPLGLVNVNPSSKWFSWDTRTPIKGSILEVTTLPRITHTVLEIYKYKGKFLIHIICILLWYQNSNGMIKIPTWDRNGWFGHIFVRLLLASLGNGSVPKKSWFHYFW